MNIRPRKVLVDEITRGLDSQMSDAELMCIVACNDNKRQEVLWAALCEAEHNLSMLQFNSGLNKSERARIKAAIELRHRLSRPDDYRESCADPSAVWHLMKHELPGLNREKLWVLCLNMRHRLIVAPKCVSVGSLSSCIIHPRDVFRPAVFHNAASVIVVHNHPSGDPTPSREDMEVTNRLSEAGVMMGIKLTDHIVVTMSGFRSLKEGGLL